MLVNAKWIKRAVGFVVTCGAAFFVTDQYLNREIRVLNQRIGTLELEKKELQNYAQRLSASRRLAQVDILDQRPDPRGRIVTTLRWQTIELDGALGEPRVADVFGRQVYFEALVIKFEHELVGKGDPQRGASLALFRRILGDEQEPRTGVDLRSAAPPRLAAEKPEQMLHQMLWPRFWEMVDDPRVAREYGVRIAQCEAPAVPVRPGQIWEVALDAAGGLNLRKIAERAAPPVSKKL